MTDLRTVEIRIGGRPPTPNNRPDKSGYEQRLKREWREKATKAAQDAIGDSFGPPMRRADVEVEFVVPDIRDRDLDNLFSSIKWLTDGIVLGGVLVDDNTRVINAWHFPGVRVERGQQATIYRITELDAGPELGL